MNKQDFPYLTNNHNKIAVIAGSQEFTYGDLHQEINKIAAGLLGNKSDLQEARIAFLLPASVEYIAVMHGIWRAGGIAVPLNVASAINELDHYLSNTGVSLFITADDFVTDELRTLCVSLDIPLSTVEDISSQHPTNLPELAGARRCLILFTSGTTSKPKGVVHTFNSIRAQITCLLEAWEWSDQDVIPLFLPLHHIHGIINILSCGLWAGATVHLFPRFNIETIAGQISTNTYTLFMAVPTIYVKFINHFEHLEDSEVTAICAGFRAMRLNISGSAACPVKLFKQWHSLTGQTLLERYGMTEIGMGISNPYNGERRAGYVGQSLPGVSVQLYDDNNQPVTGPDSPGEIRIKSDNLFLEYWENPKATRESFIDGWFCTGDMAVIEEGYYRIMGRSSIDIIKSGGYKLSALEIEGVLLNHDAISEVAVIGVEDETWGEAVAAVVALNNDKDLHLEDLKLWCKDKMSSYKIPKLLKIVPALPRNAMGKVTKPDLKTLF